MAHHVFDLSQARSISETVFATELEGVLVLTPNIFPDERGSYAELSRINELEQAIGTEFTIRQLNCAVSTSKVARGFHAENWQKLVTPISGELYVVLLDARPNSSTFGQTLGLPFTTGGLSLQTSYFLPAGVAHGLCVSRGPANLVYAVNALYKTRDRKFDLAIALDDTALNIPWPIPLSECTVSVRDRAGLSLANWVLQLQL